jgi:hypothetical protein
VPSALKQEQRQMLWVKSSLALNREQNLCGTKALQSKQQHQNLLRQSLLLPTPTSTPTPTPTTSPTPTQINFVPWGTDVDSKTLSDIAQQKFQQWVKERSGQPKNHTQLIQVNRNTNRIELLKKSDDLGAQLFSSYFKQGSTTIIGANESWTLEQLAKSGWTG